MQIISPGWLPEFDGLTAGLTTRDIKWPNTASMDHSSVGRNNRQQLLRELNLETRELFTVSQQHGGLVVNADVRPAGSDGDAIIALTSKSMIAVGVADCPAILLYDPTTGARAAIHSGWRGTEKNITNKTVSALIDSYGVDPRQIWAWISPAAQQSSYEVESDVAHLFDNKYLQQKDDVKFLLDVPGAVHDQLLASGVPSEQIERSRRDTITDTTLHSYRRGGEDYGLMLALIGTKFSTTTATS